MKAVFVDREEGDETGVLYINGKYAVGHYYLDIDGAAQLLRFLDPDVEIEVWEIPDHTYDLLSGFPTELPNDFVQQWNAE